MQWKACFPSIWNCMFCLVVMPVAPLSGTGVLSFEKGMFACFSTDNLLRCPPLGRKGSYKNRLTSSGHEPKPRDDGGALLMRVARPPLPLRVALSPAAACHRRSCRLAFMAATEPVDARATRPPLPTCVSLPFPFPHLSQCAPLSCPRVLTGHTGLLLVGPRGVRHFRAHSHRARDHEERCRFQRRQGMDQGRAQGEAQKPFIHVQRRRRTGRQRKREREREEGR